MFYQISVCSCAAAVLLSIRGNKTHSDLGAHTANLIHILHPQKHSAWMHHWVSIHRKHEKTHPEGKEHFSAGSILYALITAYELWDCNICVKAMSWYSTAAREPITSTFKVHIHVHYFNSSGKRKARVFHLRLQLRLVRIHKQQIERHFITDAALIMGLYDSG